MKKFKVIQTTVATAMAVSMFGLTACDILFGDNDQTGDGNTYEVTLNINGGDLMDSLSEYVSGEATPLPNAEKAHYTFDGWYTDAQFTGNPVFTISKSTKGNVEYWAKWTPETYTIKYYLDGTEYTESTVTSYTYNQATNLPAPTKNNYSLDGWYESASYGGNSVSTITAGEYGNKEYYAKWNADTYSVTLNLNEGKLTTNLTGYTYGVGATLPTPTKDGYRFDGWFTQNNGGGTKVESITATDTGNKTYYAKWTLTAAIDVKASGGYEEGAFIEINPTSKVNLSNIQVSYKALDDIQGYKKIGSADSALIREVTKDGKTYIRADIVGLSEGGYSIKVSADGSEVQRDVAVTSYDRSGYAHFGKTDGVGAYKDDGTPKANAQIIYVTEATKNSVTATFGSKTYTGIGNILTNLKEAKNPVIVRIIGRVAAATWNELTYTKTGSNTDKDGNLLETAIKGKNGTQLPTTEAGLTQQALIEGGYNTLNTSEYTVLNGLSSKATYKSGAYDSCWNDCSISSGAHDVTVEGIGTDAEIFQWGLTWKSANSIEVRNLTFDDYTEDACSFEGSTDTTNTGKTPDKFNSKNLWVHHCVFNEGKNYWDVSDEQDKHEGDGATDFKRCSYVTTSYNYYYKNHKTGLVGSDDNVFTSSITFHHNYYKQCVSRLPLARVANMHMYNNYYHGSTGTNMSLRSGAYAFIEYCYFENANNPIQTQEGNKILDGQSSKLNGYAKVYKCEFVGKQVDTSSYNVTILTKDSDRTKVITNDNIYAKDFDTNATYFYYDSTNKCSKVSNLITDLSLVKSKIPDLAGVHKQ